MKIGIAALCALVLVVFGSVCNGVEFEAISGEEFNLEGSRDIHLPQQQESPISLEIPTNTEPVGEPSASAFPQNEYKSNSEGTPSTGTNHKYSFTSITTSKPIIAITFDDGPNAQLTPKLLNILKERAIPATFYVVGANAAEYPDILKRMVAEGHEIGNHSWSHPALTKLSSNGVKSQLDRTNEVITRASGQPAATMRPPYGATNAALDRRINDEFGMKVVLWSVDPQDWRFRNSERVANYIITHTKPGDIILAHDIHATTVAAMPKVFDALLEKGFQFVTVSQLLSMNEPGRGAKRGRGEEGKRGNVLSEEVD